MKISQIKLNFAISVEVDDNILMLLSEITNLVARLNQGDGRCHWTASSGSECSNPHIEPITFNDEVYVIETCEREDYSHRYLSNREVVRKSAERVTQIVEELGTRYA
jgi:hypothetical protein